MALTAVEQRVLPTLVALRAAQSECNPLSQSLVAGMDAAAQAAPRVLPAAPSLSASQPLSPAHAHAERLSVLWQQTL